MQTKAWIPYVLVGLASAAPQEPTTTPSATATCEPHTDHWHCPSGVPQPSLQPDGKPNPKYQGGEEDKEDAPAPTATCEPHTDHWHCPSGVPQPSVQPDGKPNPKYKGDDAKEGEDKEGDDEKEGHDGHDHDSDSKECTPHGDHWHCPSGVPEPDHAPTQTTSAGAPAETSPSGTAASPSPTAAGSSVRASLSVAAMVAGSVLFATLLL